MCNLISITCYVCNYLRVNFGNLLGGGESKPVSRSQKDYFENKFFFLKRNFYMQMNFFVTCSRNYLNFPRSSIFFVLFIIE